MMGMEFRVIIAGCRDFNDYELLREKCDHMLSKKKDTLPFGMESPGVPRT